MELQQLLHQLPEEVHGWLKGNATNENFNLNKEDQQEYIQEMLEDDHSFPVIAYEKNGIRLELSFQIRTSTYWFDCIEYEVSEQNNITHLNEEKTTTIKVYSFEEAISKFMKVVKQHQKSVA